MRGQTEPGLVAFYDIRPRNRAGLLLQPRAHKVLRCRSPCGASCQWRWHLKTSNKVCWIFCFCYCPYKMDFMSCIDFIDITYLYFYLLYFFYVFLLFISLLWKSYTVHSKKSKKRKAKPISVLYLSMGWIAWNKDCDWLSEWQQLWVTLSMWVQSTDV